MQHSTVLFCVNTETRAGEIKEVAERMADKGRYLAVLVHAGFPTVPVNAHGAMPYGGVGAAETWTKKVNDAQDSLRAQFEQIKSILGDVGCPGDVRPIICAHADIQSHVGQSAKFADVAIMASNLPTAPAVLKALQHGVLFRSPIGLLLNADPTSEPRRVFVAWDDSPAASRAVHLALPMLRAAEEVTVACFDPKPVMDGELYEPGAALANWLGHHGCKVEVAQYPSGGMEIGSCILERSRELGADVMVAGAYGHSRLRQAVFGGTTRSLMEQTDQAVFLAH